MHEQVKGRASVIIPAYNAEKYVVAAIESVLMQAYPDVELILVDDGSTDNTRPLITRYERREPVRIRHVLLNDNAGEVKATRAGFAVATGEYLFRLSADDMWFSNHHISEQIAELEKHGCGFAYDSDFFVGTDVNHTMVTTSWLCPPTRFFHNEFQKLDNPLLSNPLMALAIFMERNPINSSALVIRRDAYDALTLDVGSRVAWDTITIAGLFMNGVVGHSIKRCDALYRTHPGQGSNSPTLTANMDKIYHYIAAEVISGNYPQWLKVYMKRF